MRDSSVVPLRLGDSHACTNAFASVDGRVQEVPVIGETRDDAVSDVRQFFKELVRSRAGKYPVTSVAQRYLATT